MAVKAWYGLRVRVGVLSESSKSTYTNRSTSMILMQTFKQTMVTIGVISISIVVK